MGDHEQVPLFPPPFERVVLMHGGAPIEPPRGLVYSTSPTTWTDDQGTDRVVKGPDVGMVVAEALGYVLARRVGLRVPPFALAGLNGQGGGESFYFASQKLSRAMRDAGPWLKTNTCMETLAHIVLFDVWVVNFDRNYGGILAEKNEGTGVVELIAIDFEKSVALRGPHPLVTCPTIAPNKLWPQGELGDRLRGRPIPPAGLAAIRGVTTDEVEKAVEAIRVAVGPAYDWGDSTVKVLADRRDALEPLARETWR